MTEDPTNNGDFWQYEVDSVQRGGTTAATLARRHGEVHCPDPPDDHEAKDREEQAFDSDGIPTGI